MTNFEQFKITQFDKWSVYLHQNQCYLGRLYIAANHDNDVDLFDMTVEERDEFFDVGKAVKKALAELFNPDRLNYANLQNEWHHLHIHIIPRYASPRIFDEISFIDEKWGKNYAPYNKDFKVPEATLFKIITTIRDKTNMNKK